MPCTKSTAREVVSGVVGGYETKCFRAWKFWKFVSNSWGGGSGSCYIYLANQRPPNPVEIRDHQSRLLIWKTFCVKTVMRSSHVTSNIGFVYTGRVVILPILLTTRGFQNLFYSPNYSTRSNWIFRRRSILFHTPQRPLVVLYNYCIVIIMAIISAQLI